MLFEKEKWYEKPWFAVCAGIGILLAIAGITIIGYALFYAAIVGGICWVLSLFGVI